MSRSRVLILHLTFPEGLDEEGIENRVAEGMEQVGLVVADSMWDDVDADDGCKVFNSNGEDDCDE